MSYLAIILKEKNIVFCQLYNNEKEAYSDIIKYFVVVEYICVWNLFHNLYDYDEKINLYIPKKREEEEKILLDNINPVFHMLDFKKKYTSSKEFCKKFKYEVVKILIENDNIFKYYMKGSTIFNYKINFFI